jgi:hypothetical protein
LRYWRFHPPDWAEELKKSQFSPSRALSGCAPQIADRVQRTSPSAAVSRSASCCRLTADGNSDAHSPPMLGGEATTFGTCLDCFAMAAVPRTGDGLIGTAEFYPAEGMYHLDGHREVHECAWSPRRRHPRGAQSKIAGPGAAESRL